MGVERALRDVADVLRGARRVTALCHENPDADTIGAAIAIRLIAERLGAEAEVVSADPPGPMYSFLPGIDEVRSQPMLEPDVAVTCDAATIGRIGPLAVDGGGWLARSRIVNVDHHRSNDGYGHVNLVMPEAAATCEVVALLVPVAGLELDAPLATALLTGIVRDSHGFSDAATSGTTLRIAADLVDAGASLSDIHRRVLGETSRTAMALWGRMLGGIGERCSGRVVYSVLTRRMLQVTGARQEDADGLVEFLSSARGARVAILCREVAPRETRVSVRTAEPVDATGVARAFGGGGHARRAGCTIHEPVDVALERVLVVAAEQLERDEAGQPASG